MTREQFGSLLDDFRFVDRNNISHLVCKKDTMWITKGSYRVEHWSKSSNNDNYSNSYVCYYKINIDYITRCRPSKGRRCIPDSVLKNEGSMMQTYQTINVHANTDTSLNRIANIISQKTTILSWLCHGPMVLFKMQDFWPFGRVGSLDVYATPIGCIRHPHMTYTPLPLDVYATLLTINFLTK